MGEIIPYKPKIKRYELVEITVPAGSTGQINFQPNAQLRDQADQVVCWKGIKVFPITSYANSQKTNSLPGLPAADIPKICLVLNVDGQESIKLIPIAQLININDFQNPFQEQEDFFDDLTGVDLEASYIQFSSASAGADYVVPFGITYARFKRDPQNPEKWIER